MQPRSNCGYMPCRRIVQKEEIQPETLKIRTQYDILLNNLPG